jgi:probable lipoprotein NlpC
MDNITEYIQIPFKDGGRDRSGVDCYGLVLLVEKEMFGKDLGDVVYASSEDTETNARLVDLQRATIEAEPVLEPEEGDLVLMQFGPVPAHIGIYVSPGYVLHTLASFGTVCQRIDSPNVRHRIVGYFRV